MATDAEKVLALHRQGLSARLIAAEVRCSIRTVTRIRARNDLTAPLPARSSLPADPELLERARVMLADGCSQREVRATTGLTTRTVRRHFPTSAWTVAQSGEHASTARAFNRLPDTLAKVAA